MKGVGVLIFVCMLMFSFAFVLAVVDDSNETDIADDSNETDDDDDEIDDDEEESSVVRIRQRIRSNGRDIRIEYRSEIEDIRVRYRDDRTELNNVVKELIATLNDSDLTEEEREEIRGELEDLRKERREIRIEYRDDAKGIRVEFRSEIRGFFNETRTEYRLKNGRNFSVKIMPEVASERAIERLGLKVCNESNNCTIEFKEVGEGNKTRLVYSLRAKKEGRFLGLFKTRMNVESEIDAETGEVIRTRKPWWAFLVNE